MVMIQLLSVIGATAGVTMGAPRESAALQCARAHLPPQIRKQIVDGYHQSGFNGLPAIPEQATASIASSCLKGSQPQEERSLNLIRALKATEVLSALEQSLERRFKIAPGTAQRHWDALAAEEKSVFVVSNDKDGGSQEEIRKAVKKLAVAITPEAKVPAGQEERLVQDIMFYGIVRASLDNLSGSY
jgi:hypothetical protein